MIYKTKGKYLDLVVAISSVDIYSKKLPEVERVKTKSYSKYNKKFYRGKTLKGKK